MKKFEIKNTFYKNQANKNIKNSINFVNDKAKENNNLIVTEVLSILKDVFKSIGLLCISDNLIFEDDYIRLNSNFDIKEILFKNSALFFEPYWEKITNNISIDFNGININAKKITEYLSLNPYVVENIPYFMPNNIGYYRVISITELEKNFLKQKKVSSKNNVNEFDIDKIDIYYDYIGTIRRIMGQKLLLSNGDTSKSQLLNDEVLLKKMESIKELFNI